ncbi:hypothetical protein J8273_5788 [Carpediemonas membranifera]|uniref:Uncharacterized protein n=1 Tax=Carpediemonas membranifera TaxID=201153 RepID=A0A8J6AUK3_9EUKA|nr:hypothetical protein J8273_5788 [Carpediemonas membranifera]|eukprot:KAG9392855.1 hypothetical protein J8273_5788 [Carpediemonas membranifera]
MSSIDVLNEDLETDSMHPARQIQEFIDNWVAQCDIPSPDAPKRTRTRMNRKNLAKLRHCPKLAAMDKTAWTKDDVSSLHDNTPAHTVPVVGAFNPQAVAVVESACARTRHKVTSTIPLDGPIAVAVEAMCCVYTAVPFADQPWLLVLGGVECHAEVLGINYYELLARFGAEHGISSGLPRPVETSGPLTLGSMPVAPGITGAVVHNGCEHRLKVLAVREAVRGELAPAVHPSNIARRLMTCTVCGVATSVASWEPLCEVCKGAIDDAYAIQSAD